jgi:triosephosphate isomerase
MNGSRSHAASLVDGILEGKSDLGDVEVGVCPPFVLIPMVADRLAGSGVAWGAQNLDPNESGAFTGEVSGSMLADFDCRYCIVGHSERRALYGETNDLVAAKFQAAQRDGLVPILCVGETLAQREGDETEAVVAAQLNAVLDAAGPKTMVEAVIAYEPVWAIGTGMTATPEQAQAVHAYIRELIAGRDADVAGSVRILYGGSVKAGNAAELFAQPDIDGGLIGGASLQSDEFLAICRAACQ